jgi:hypothetical protein
MCGMDVQEVLGTTPFVLFFKYNFQYTKGIYMVSVN